MKQKQLQLVTFEQAKRLDAVGFDYPVFNWYSKTGDLHIQGNVKGFKGWKSWHLWEATKGVRFSAPTVALALKWIRDENGMRFLINMYIDPIVYFGVWVIKYDSFETTDNYATYEAAESALLDELLKELEENK
jgi:hypothetical protein